MLSMILASASAFSAESPDAPPALEEQFHAKMSHTRYHDGVPYETNGGVQYFDFPNQRFRQEFVHDGDNVTSVMDVVNNVSFIIRSKEGTCTIMPKTRPPSPFVILPDAADLGPTTFDGQPAEVWSATIPPAGSTVGQTILTIVQAQPVAGRNPVALNFNASAFMTCTRTTPCCECKPAPCTETACLLSDVTDRSGALEVGPMADWLFGPVPAGCTPRAGGAAPDVEFFNDYQQHVE